MYIATPMAMAGFFRLPFEYGLSEQLQTLLLSNKVFHKTFFFMHNHAFRPGQQTNGDIAKEHNT